MPIRVQMPNGTVRPFREGTPKSVIRRAQQDMLADMKASGAYDGFDFSEFEEKPRKVIVTQNSAGATAYGREVPQHSIPIYPQYITDQAEIERIREHYGEAMDNLSDAGKFGGVAARLARIPRIGSFIGALGTILGWDPVQRWMADEAIAAHNRQAASIYNMIGNNYLKQHGGIR